MRKVLSNTTTMQDFIKKLNTLYDLKSCNPSPFILKMLDNQIGTMTSATTLTRAEALKSKNLYNFLQVFAKSYDKINKELSVSTRNTLIDKVPNVMTMTRCKKIRA